METQGNVVRVLAIGLAVAAGLTMAAPPDAGAALVICQRKQKIRLRADACKGKETPVAASELGVVGPPGPVTGALPSGVTLRGTFGFDFAATVVSEFAEESISFGFRLSSAPTPVVRPVGAAPSTDCPGTVGAPEAAPGMLCIYEGSASNVESLGPFSAAGDSDVADRFGVLLFLNAIGPGRTFADGSWAVTAP